MTPRNDSDGSDTPADLIVYAARLIRQVRRTVGVPAAHRVLSVLDETGPVTISRLAVADGSSQPSMSAQVQAMADAGLVTKEPNPGDARASVVAMTDTGREALTATREQIAAGVLTRCQTIDPADLAVAVHVLRAATEPTGHTPETPASPEKGIL